LTVSAFLACEAQIEQKTILAIHQVILNQKELPKTYY